MSHLPPFRLAAVAVTLVVALLGPSSHVLAAEGRFERTLTVTGAVTLTVMTGSGRISVQPGGDGQVRVVATIQTSDGWGQSNAMSPEAAIKAIEANPPIEQQGNAIRVGDMKDRPEAKNVSISYEVIVPRQVSLTSKTGSGTQVIGDVVGPVQASTGSGTIELGRIAGDTKASSGSGDILVAGTQGTTDVSSGSGDIDLRAADGPVAARTGSGDIVITNRGRGDVQASSGSGDITARGVAGTITVSSASGSIELDGAPTGAWTVSSASGRITISLPIAANFMLDASSSSGSIDSDFAVTTTETRRRALKGTVGSGGPVVRASTASGSIRVVKSAR